MIVHRKKFIATRSLGLNFLPEYNIFDKISNYYKFFGLRLFAWATQSPTQNDTSIKTGYPAWKKEQQLKE